jgi:hypothetical protein
MKVKRVKGILGSYTPGFSPNVTIHGFNPLHQRGIPHEVVDFPHGPPVSGH